jgi:hypothetical protein
VGGGVDERAAVVERHHLHAGRQDAGGLPTIQRVEAEIEKINASGILPPGVQVVPLYDRSALTPGGRMPEALIFSISASTRWIVGRLWPPRLRSTMSRGGQSLPTIQRVEAEIEKINASGILPPGVQVVPMSPSFSCPTMPRRGALLTWTSATSPTSTGTPPTWLMG